MPIELTTPTGLQTARAALGIAVPGASPILPMAKWGTALAAVLAGTASATALFQGDSTFMGVAYGTPAGAPTGTAAVAARHFTIPAAFAKWLNAYGVPTSTDSFVGFNIRSTDTVADYNAYNPNVQVDTATWTLGGTITLGGNTFRKASTTAGVITFTPDNKSTHLDVYLLNNISGSAAVWTIKCDGTTVLTYTTTGTPNTPIKVTTPIQTEGFHVWTIEANSGNTSNLVGAIARNSVSARVDVVNTGYRGVDTPTMALKTGFTAMDVLDVLLSDIAFFGYGINDVRTGGSNTTVPNLTTAANTITARNVAVGDLVMVSPHNIGPASDAGTGAHMSDLFALYSSIATTRSANEFRIRDMIGSYNLGNRKGLYFDELHLQDRATADAIGQSLARVALSGARLALAA